MWRSRPTTPPGVESSGAIADHGPLGPIALWNLSGLRAMMAPVELMLNLAAGAAATLMILVGGYAIAALWWDDLT